MKGEKLTVKQQKFVEEYLICNNAAEAARRAGYSAKIANRTGSENLSKPVIKRAIGRILDEQAQKRRATLDEVMEFTTAMMRGEISEEVVAVEGEGDGVSRARILRKQASARDRLDAAKCIVNQHNRREFTIKEVEQTLRERDLKIRLLEQKLKDRENSEDKEIEVVVRRKMARDED